MMSNLNQELLRTVILEDSLHRRKGDGRVLSAQIGLCGFRPGQRPDFGRQPSQS